MLALHLALITTERKWKVNPNPSGGGTSIANKLTDNLDVAKNS
jgi:hypothetical protein